MHTSVFEALARAARQNEPVALGIISGAKGSSPQKTGAKALFFPDGRLAGTLGGGCLEAEVQRRAITALRRGTPEAFELLLDHDFGWDDGLVCGGKVRGLILPGAEQMGEAFWSSLAARASLLRWGVTADYKIRWHPGSAAETESWLYAEVVSPRCALWIAGAGHIAQAVAPLALGLDFTVTVFDDRPALVNHRCFPAETILRAETWERLLAEPPPQTPGFGLIVTRGHRHDALVLKSWIRRPFVFLGMIGSARKARTIFEHFLAEQLATPEQVAQVACPVGLPIGSRSVPEIAVSIMAQYIQKRAESGHACPLPYAEVTEG